MLHEEADPKKLLRPITVDMFLQRMKSRDPKAVPKADSTYEISGVDAGFQVRARERVETEESGER